MRRSILSVYWGCNKSLLFQTLCVCSPNVFWIKEICVIYTFYLHDTFFIPFPYILHYNRLFWHSIFVQKWIYFWQIVCERWKVQLILHTQRKLARSYFAILFFLVSIHIISTINSKINGTPKRYLLARFESTFDFSHSEFTCT